MVSRLATDAYDLGKILRAVKPEAQLLCPLGVVYSATTHQAFRIRFEIVGLQEALRLSIEGPIVLQQKISLRRQLLFLCPGREPRRYGPRHGGGRAA